MLFKGNISNDLKKQETLYGFYLEYFTVVTFWFQQNITLFIWNTRTFFLVIQRAVNLFFQTFLTNKHFLYICIKETGNPTMKSLASRIQRIHNALLYKWFINEYTNSGSELLTASFFKMKKHISINVVSGNRTRVPWLLVRYAMPTTASSQSA